MLGPLDLAVIGAWLLLTFAMGVWFSRRASRSTEAFFVSGRSLPWWAVGTSMVATTFAADTPLVVSGWVASAGIAENWVWWTGGLSGMCGVFLFARLWQRSGVLTDAELVELRYGGPGGAALRAAKALWFGVFMNLLVVAWVMRAMAKIAAVVLGARAGETWLGLDPEVAIVLGLFVLAVAYTGAAGLWGVVATDVVQYVAATCASLGLAVVAWCAGGGLEGLRSAFAERALDWPSTTALVPSFGDASPDGAAARFLVIVGVVWWGQSNVDGGGYLAQRLLAARDDRHALWAYLWYTLAHLCLRPWPWIAVGLAGMALLGVPDDPETIYPRMMVELLPAGFFGLMVASFLAAFMSTIDTQLNWGASLAVNDLYRRFLRPGRSEVHYVRASRAAVVGLALAGATVSFAIDDVGLAWKLAISVTAGLGTVYVARWYWWRVGARSEFAAMLAAAVGTLAFAVLDARHPASAGAGTAWGGLAAVPAGWLRFPFSAAATALVATAVWVSVTLAGRPPAPEGRLEFYRRVRPGGPGWRAVAGHLPGFERDGPTPHTFLGIAGGIAAAYGTLLGVGWLLLGDLARSAGALGVAVLGGVLAGREVARVTRSGAHGESALPAARERQPGE